MKQFYIICLFLSLPWLLLSQEQETRFGGILSLEGSKSLCRNWELSLEEEVRLVNNNNAFDRSVTSLGIDYTFFNSQLKLGAYYAFMYLYNDKNYYESRHRYYLNLMFRQMVGNDFLLSWRGRLQGTTRNESIGRYKVNPKYVMKNKFEVQYTIWGRPWKPYLSCDLSTDLNNPAGNSLTRIRFQGGTSWRLNRTDYVDFYLRWDEYLSAEDPRVLSLGVGFRRKF